MKKIKIFLITITILLLIPICINFYVCLSVKNNIYSSNNIKNKYDVAMILGCSVLKSGEPSKMLRDRLNKGIELYNNGIVDNILITGDHSEGYSEIDIMYKYLINSEIPKENILIDKKGYSTGNSIINYKNNYKDKSVVIVTQEYHLYRALFIAKKLNINAVGVYADKITYVGNIAREIREVLARIKDFCKFTF